MAKLQVENIYQKAVTEGLEHAISLERFQRYLDWTQGDKYRAFELYAFNMRVSEALYTPVHVLEIALRNRFTAVLSDAFGENWFTHPSLNLSETQRQQLDNARKDIIREGKTVQSGRLVAALTFGFWTSLLSPEAENLWQQTLHKAARQENGKGLTRKHLSKPLLPIRVLRNRIAHHEPVWHWDLPLHHANMLQVTAWLSPAAAKWSAYHSNFTQAWGKKPVL